MTTPYDRLDAWVDAHFAEEVALPAGAGARADRHAARATTRRTPSAPPTLLAGFGFAAERHPVPDDAVREHGLGSITNLIVRRRYGDGPTIALNAHGDVVPPGEGWTPRPLRRRGRRRQALRPRRGGQQERLRDLHLRACARSSRSALPLAGRRRAALHLRRGIRRRARPRAGCCSQGLTKPDLLLAAGFSYQVVTAHNGCLQLEVTVHGKMAHAAIPSTGIDALQGAVAILNALYAQNDAVPAASRRRSRASPIRTSTSAASRAAPTPTSSRARSCCKLDRRMIPEEDPVEVEATLRAVIADAAGDGARHPGRDPAAAARATR